VKTVWRSGAILWDAIDRFNRNDGTAMAGFIAFSSLLSVFPFLIVAATLIGAMLGDARSDQIIDALFRIAPDHVARTVEPVADEVLKRRSGGVLTVSALFAIWVASNAVEAFRIAFDRAYKVDDRRHFITGRLLAIGFVLLGAVVTALLGFSVILSPLLLHLAEQWSGERVPGGAGLLIYTFGLVVFAGFLFLMHRYLPGERLPLVRLWPGVVVSTILWMFGAVFFSFYLRYTPSFTVTYGALTGVVITLLFFYLTGAAIIFGAEVNAAWNRAGLQKG